jgi:formate hydrogenlyase subunit 4
VYWIAIMLAIAGWFWLGTLRVAVAGLFLFYVLLVTLGQLPFDMNPWYRMGIRGPSGSYSGGHRVVRPRNGK